MHTIYIRQKQINQVHDVFFSSQCSLVNNKLVSCYVQRMSFGTLPSFCHNLYFPSWQRGTADKPQIQMKYSSDLHVIKFLAFLAEKLWLIRYRAKVPVNCNINLPSHILNVITRLTSLINKICLFQSYLLSWCLFQSYLLSCCHKKET